MKLSNTISPIIIACLLLPGAFISCKEETVDFQQNNCKKFPQFVRGLGFKSNNSFFGTTDEKVMGLQLLESSQPGNPNATITKKYQHASWRMGGWLAPIVIDEEGNIFSAPAPFINVYNNPAKDRNTIYKVDSKTGIMEEWLKLPLPDSSTAQNPYGIIGMIYLCETNTFYASTVAGSDRQNERGCIYAIDTKTKKIIDKITAIDAMGMGISYVDGKRKLYFGTGRSSDIYSVTLDKDGKFSGKPAVCFSLNGLGPRGDDKVRRIFTDNAGNLTVAGFEFNFNLIAPREKQETRYSFVYDEEEKKWNAK